MPVPPRLPRPAGLDALIAPQHTPSGPLHLLELRAGMAQPLNGSSLQALSLSPNPIDASSPLYFDTETTGLAGGTGTLAFLLGTAEIRQGEIVVSQVHLAGPGQERPMLEWLANRIEACTVLLSFNGRSFDWPLLRSRYVMNRLPPPQPRPHVDLLHCARRVFRHQFDELRLSTLERRVLKVHRQADIEGALIPAAWFDYLRTGRVAVLSRVLSHNAQDVRSMVALVNCLSGLWEEQHATQPATALGLAALAVRNKDTPRALRFLEKAGQGPTAAHALSLQAEIHQRNGEYRAAVEVLLRAVAASSNPAVLHLRIAKLYEHRLHDFGAALHHAHSAIAAEKPSAHGTRKQRLVRRLHNATPTPM